MMTALWIVLALIFWPITICVLIVWAIISFWQIIFGLVIAGFVLLLGLWILSYIAKSINATAKWLGVTDTPIKSEVLDKFNEAMKEPEVIDLTIKKGN